MLDRRTFIGGAALAMLGLSKASAAQRTGTIPRIGFLTPGPNPREAAFWQGMRDLGYVDGKTIAVDRHSAEGDFSRLRGLATEIVKQATATIPIVVVGSLDPIAAGAPRSDAVRCSRYA